MFQIKPWGLRLLQSYDFTSFKSNPDTYDHQFKPWTLSFWCGGLIFEFDWGFKLICFQKWVFDLKLKFGVWFETKETIILNL